MKKTLIAAAFVSSLFAVPAFADCATDIGKIDEAMKSAKLDETSSTKANELLTKAKTAMTAKDEASCTAATKEIMQMVGLNTSQ